MSNVDAISGTSTAYPMASGATYMSPDALLAYCQMQLGGIDNEIKNQMKGQLSKLDERKAAETVLAKLESFGTKGPDNYGMQDCVNTFNTAINQLPVGNPTRTELSRQLNDMTTKYSYVAQEEPGLDKPPQNDEWKGTTDALSTLIGDIKSGADIQMLQLQDLVSQRQQAVQLISGMMSKEDQTLEGLAKAIGQ
jgi:hypothetical protein